MQSFQSAFSDAQDWLQAVNDCLQQIKTQGHTLGFVYASDHFANALQLIVDALKTGTGVEDWVGTVGMGICSPAKETYDQPALSIMVSDVPKENYRLINNINTDLSSFKQEHQDWYQQNNAHLGIMHGDPHNQSIPQLIQDLSDALPLGFLVGGLTSSNSDNLQIVGHQLTQGGLSGVMLSEQAPVITGLTQGCSPIGPRHEITECERNIIVALDNQPALQVMKEDMGEVLSRSMQNIGQYIFAGLPVSGSDTGDYLVRNLLGIDETNQLVAIGDMIQPGQEVMFCQRNGNTAVEDMNRMLASVKKRIGEQKPRGALYYSCLGRGRYLFGQDSEELKMVQAALGETPLTGFFCNGEIAHNQLYGYTGVLTVFV